MAEWVTQRALAAHLDLTDRSIRELTAAGVLERGAQGYELEASRVAYIRHLRERAAGRRSDERGPDGPLDLVAERARLAKAQADQTELKNAELRGELVPRGDLESSLVALASAIVLRLDSIPSKAGPVVRATETDAEGEAVLRRYIDEARVELADLGRDVLEGRLELRLVAPCDEGSGGDGARGAPAAAPADGERVGRPRAKAKPGKRSRARTVGHRAR